MQTRLHIALVCVSLRAGGTERIVTRIANHLSQHHRVSLITLVAVESFYPVASAVRVRLPAALGNAPKAFRLLAQIRHLFTSLRNDRPDICLVFGEDIAAAGCLITRIAGVAPVLTFLRGTPARSLGGINGLLNPLALRLSRKIVVQTQAGRASLSDRYGDARLVVLPNPIECPRSVRAFEARDSIIVNVGSMGRKKNQAALLRAFAQVKARAGWQLLFVGDGPDRSSLEDLARELRVQDQVRFAGERDDAAEMIQTARIFAFTSLSEGFPNALAEAMSAGCAPISYDCPTGPAEMIEHGANGFLIPNDDESAFAAHLEQLMTDDGLQGRFSQAARAGMTRFDMPRVMGMLDNLISESVQDAAVDGHQS